MKKIIIPALACICIFGASGALQPAYAVNDVDLGTIEQVETDDSSSSSDYLYVDEDGNVSDAADAYMEDVTLDEFGELIVEKAYEIVGIMQAVGVPLIVIAFICSVFYTVFASFSRRMLVSQGFIAMGICIVCYAALVNAYAIVAYCANWLLA